MRKQEQVGRAQEAIDNLRRITREAFKCLRCFDQGSYCSVCDMTGFACRCDDEGGWVECSCQEADDA